MTGWCMKEKKQAEMVDEKLEVIETERGKKYMYRGKCKTCGCRMCKMTSRPSE